MTGPYTRRPDPVSYAGGWEVPVLLIAAGIAAAALAALTGIGVAGALFGPGWVWPRDLSDAARMLEALLTGPLRRGVFASESSRVAGPAATYVCVVVCEVVLLALAVWAGVLVGRYRRPHDQRGGMATRHDAAQALGRRQLRSARKIIRPDRYGKEADR